MMSNTDEKVYEQHGFTSNLRHACKFKGQLC
jgi:hypothetical protein